MKTFLGSLPTAAPTDIIAWADQCRIKVDGHSFDSSRTPQLIEPMKAMHDPEIRIGSLVKPVQSGGSTAAEIVCAFWARYYHGLIQFNWQDDKKAKERWERRISTLFDFVPGIKWADDRFAETICLAKFVNSTVQVQGVFADGSLDSETVPLQINEEVHLWGAGMLGKARRRQTLVWNSKAFDVSNASNEGDQFHAAYEDGTMEIWETYCPGCRQFHQMRFRWDDKHPEFGGLRFDTGAGRVAGGKYNMNKLAPTLRYQMPCGFIIRDLASDRRLRGRYRATNDGALSYKRSWTYEAVSVPEIKWIELVSEYLTAIKAIKGGDAEPMRRFVTERECHFYNPDQHLFRGEIIVNEGVKKNRKGMEKRAGRLWAADWQQGYKHLGQLEHLFLVIKDVDEKCNDQLVFEGRVDSENELIAILEEHDALQNGSGIIDCSFNTKHLLDFIYKTVAQFQSEGKRCSMNAVMSNESHRGFFLHREDGVRRFYDEGQAICGKLNVSPIYEPIMTDKGLAPDTLEPIVININKGGAISNHFFIREHKQRILDSGKKESREISADDYIDCIIPGDVSEEFKLQYNSWVRVGREAKKREDEAFSGQERFQKITKDDHMFMCCVYIDMLKDWCGLLGDRLSQLNEIK